MNLSLAKVYLRHNDPLVASRTWQMVIDEIIRTKTGENQIRWQVMAKSKWFDPLRHRLLIETQAEHLLHVLQCGKVAINVYLRRMHNFAIDMNWLPASVLPKRQWPPVKFKDKRAITVEEHQKIIAAERNPERKVFYQLCWHLGASQGDIANLKGEDVDWQNGTISFVRRKTGVPVLVHLGLSLIHISSPVHRRVVSRPACERRHLPRCAAGRIHRHARRERREGITHLRLQRTR